jgi:hypothetical protein
MGPDPDDHDGAPIDRIDVQAGAREPDEYSSRTNQNQEVAMWKIVAAGATAVFVSMSPVAYAQSSMTERLSEADWNTLTDLRIDLVKTALQLTPQQQQYWPAIEGAIRARAKNRQARLARTAETVGRAGNESTLEAMRNRDPVDFLHRRAAALAQRSADLNKLADAWEPLYKTLSQEQKQRMAALTIFVIQDLRDVAEHRRLQSGATRRGP